jgi:hypothetical protein
MHIVLVNFLIAVIKCLAKQLKERKGLFCSVSEVLVHHGADGMEGPFYYGRQEAERSSNKKGPGQGTVLKNISQ